MDPYWVPSAFWFACIRIHFRVPDCMCCARGVRGPIWVPNNLCDARRRLFMWLGCSWALLGPESPLCRCSCVCLKSSWALLGPELRRHGQCACMRWQCLLMHVCMCVYACMHVRVVHACMHVCVCVYACCACVYACCMRVCMLCRWALGGPSWTPSHPCVLC